MSKDMEYLVLGVAALAVVLFAMRGGRSASQIQQPVAPPPQNQGLAAGVAVANDVTSLGGEVLGMFA